MNILTITVLDEITGNGVDATFVVDNDNRIVRKHVERITKEDWQQQQREE